MQAQRTWQSISGGRLIWLAVLCLAQILDIATTTIGLRLGIPEDNPIVRFVLQRLGEQAMIGMKIAVVVAIILVIGRLRWPSERVGSLLLVITLLVTFAVVRNVALIVAALP